MDDFQGDYRKLSKQIGLRKFRSLIDSNYKFRTRVGPTNLEEGVNWYTYKSFMVQMNKIKSVN